MVRWLRWHWPPDTGFKIRALAVWGRARYLSVTEALHNTNFHTWMGKKRFCFFQTAETGNRTPNSTLGPPPYLQSSWYRSDQWQPCKNETLAQGIFNVGPTSKTILGQRLVFAGSRHAEQLFEWLSICNLTSLCHHLIISSSIGIRWYNMVSVDSVDLMLGQRRRWWPSIKPTQCVGAPIHWFKIFCTICGYKTSIFQSRSAFITWDCFGQL